MLGLRFLTFALIILWLIFFIILKFSLPTAHRVHLRTITLLGILLTAAGFFIEPWLELSFLGYLVPSPELLNSLFPGDMVSGLFRQLGSDGLKTFLHIFEKFTSFNGLTIHLIPTYSIKTWLITLSPLPPLTIAFPTLIIGLLPLKNRLKQISGFLLIGSSVFSILGLLFIIPSLDTIGAGANFHLALFATMLGTQLGNGPWVCIIGMLFFIVGGAIEVNDYNNQDSDYDDSLNGDKIWL